jgi:hypothetical protein
MSWHGKSYRRLKQKVIDAMRLSHKRQLLLGKTLGAQLRQMYRLRITRRLEKIAALNTAITAVTEQK